MPNDSNRAIHVVSGRASEPEAAALRAWLDASFVSGPRQLVVDLSAADAIDMAIVSALLYGAVFARARGLQFAVAAPCPNVRRMLDLNRTEALFEVFPSVESALAVPLGSSLASA